MPLSELPMSVLVSLFLTLFVLIGIYPALKRSAAKLRKLFEAAAQTVEAGTTRLDEVHDGIFSDDPGTRPLNDFEIIVLRRIAQAGGKSLSWKQVNEPLLFGDTILKKTLRSLHRRGLVQVRISNFLGQRFALSVAGHRFALEQGYIIQIQERKTLF